jgi:histidinol-phosphate/aromatic aminotransferase/cobyric acid decarboxylase-like protein/GNAT superfamily N-acetyltransferase
MPVSTAPRSSRATRPVITVATDAHRQAIYRMRHDVYARELGQHAPNAEAELRDALDDANTYLVALIGGDVAGFVSITPPGQRYSIDKYLPRDEMPFAVDGGLHEIRLLTVEAAHRRRGLAPLLMYAAQRWIESRGGTHVAALGRDEVLGLYLGVGLRCTGRQVRSGAVLYHLLHASTEQVRERIDKRARVLDRLERGARWELPVPFHEAPACYHGGAFFQSIGPAFDDLGRRRHVINADVLDAWFSPSPRVLQALHDDLEWLARTSPPTQCEGMIDTIARTRGVPAECVLPGGGSSDLIFRALPRWLSRESRVLILDPMYGEYAHVLEQVVRCRVDRLRLPRHAGYALDLDAWTDRLARGRYDLAVIVNPNSPTGRYVPRAEMETALRRVPPATRVWIDETYVEYAGAGQSLERAAAASDNVVVCKSMSKVYALSGMRAGYLCGAPDLIDRLRPYTPPWVVGLPAQLAAVRALEDAEYYEARWAETHTLREELSGALRRDLGWEVLPGIANFMLCHLPLAGPNAAEVGAGAREHGLFLRDAAGMGTAMGSHAVRVAVKDARTNRRMMDILRAVLHPPGG